MKVRLTPKNTQKMLLRQRLIIVTAVSSITGLVIALVFLFNVGNVRGVFANTTTYYSRATGNWNSASTWSTASIGGTAASSVPKDGDIVIISGHTVSVKADAAARSITILQNRNQPTYLQVSDGKKLNVSGNVELKGTDQSQVMYLDIWGEKSSVSIGGDLLVNRTDGSSKGLFSVSVKNTSVLSIAGNFTTANARGADNFSFMISDFASVNVGKDIAMENSKGSGTTSFNVQDNAIVNVDGDIKFLAEKRNQVFLSFKNNAQLILGGGILKSDPSKAFGNFEMLNQSRLTLTGKKSQLINGLANNGDNFEISTLIINSEGGNISASGNVNISTSLTLTKGIVHVDDNSSITLGSSATSSSSSAASFIDGPVVKNGSTAFVFPIGDNGKYAPLSITAPNSTSSFKAIYYNNGNPRKTSRMQTPLQVVSANEYWQLERVSGTGNTQVRLHWLDALYSGITTTSDLSVAYFDASANTWKAVGSTINSLANNQGTVTSSTVGSFGTFTFGSSGGNPLPVSLIAWDAKAKTNYVQLSWATSSETNNDFFTIERSEDGKNFEKITTVKGAGNATEKLRYAYEDKDPLPGISYYRLKQTDFNGQYEYFAIKPVNIPCAQIENCGPNPFTSNINLNYTMLKEGPVTIQLVNANGAVVYEEKALASQGNNSFSINNQQQLPKGMYIMRIHAAGQPVNYKLIKS